MMTEAEKEMKKYTNAVERRLELPRNIKARVMTDFVTSIAARREAGQTDEEIYRELGSPEEAAATLNEQMKEFVYRKSPWRFLCLAGAVLAALWLVVNCLLPEVITLMIGGMSLSEAASIGVIGGADGPTAIFVTAEPAAFSVQVAVAVAALGAFLLGFLRLRRCKAKK